MWAYNVNQDEKEPVALKRLLKPILVSAGLAGVVVAVVLAGYAVSWTGFGPSLNGKGELQPAKSLWDWMTLLIVPAVLALLGYGFSRSQKKQADAAALEEQREKVLQAYFDSMTELLLQHNLRASAPGSEVRTVARARTLTVLRQLNNNRKSMVVQFLVEANLVQDRGPISLRNADLHRLYLADADLHGADFQLAYLFGAYFDNANLAGADLREANLFGASFDNADLSRANLENAHYYTKALARARSIAGATLSSLAVPGP